MKMYFVSQINYSNILSQLQGCWIQLAGASLIFTQVSATLNHKHPQNETMSVWF